MRCWFVILAAFAAVSLVLAQPATQPAGGPGATQPAIEPMSARVIQLIPSASACTVDASGKEGEWKPVKVGDVFSAGTQVRTQLRARVVLAFGDDTVVVIERATLASIDQFHRSADTKRVKLGLGHGTIRAGVAETTLRSDMTIESPTATLSKRGTMDFGFSYEPSTGRFRIFLDKQGLVEALRNATGDNQLIHPGQYVTQTMQHWIDTLTEDRWVPIVDTNSLTDAEVVFNKIKTSGLAVVDPTDGGNIYTIAGRDLNSVINQTSGLPITPLIRPSQGGIISRPEGNFGTGSLSVGLKRAR